MDDSNIVALEEFLLLEERVVALMRTTLPGTVTDDVISELKAILDKYEGLLRLELPLSWCSWCTADHIKGLAAMATKTLARAYSSQNDYSNARFYYNRAIQLFEDCGKPDLASECQTVLARLIYQFEVNVDNEIKRLQGVLSSLPSGSIDYTEALIELAALYSENGDKFEAEKLFLQAQKALDNLGGNPSGHEFSDAVSVFAEGDGTSFSVMFQVRQLYQQLYWGLMRIYQESKDVEKEAEYQNLFDKHVGPARRDELVESLRDIDITKLLGE